jgi:hypothetical protein
MNKIICVGDGYAANHIWPEWPAIIQALYPDVAHENFGAVGAGDEFITTAVVQSHIRNPNAFFIVQWAIPSRFDKLLQNDSWDNIINNDSVYHFNRVKLYDETWWLSSASQQAPVEQYHEFYVEAQQAKTRSFNFKYLVENLLKQQALFFTLEQMILYSNDIRFQHTRLKEIQPSPIVHLQWTEEHIVPHIPYPLDNSRLVELKKRINQHKWQAYDPDRAEIWDKMSNI